MKKNFVEEAWRIVLHVTVNSLPEKKYLLWLAQLNTVFSRMMSPLVLKLSLDDSAVQGAGVFILCLVVNDGEKIGFGKKNVKQLLEFLKA